MYNSYIAIEYYSLMLSHIGHFCTILITVKILSRIKAYLAVHWEDIGYELIAEHKVANIASSRDDVEKKCFAMLKTWLETDSNPCYCKLFAALKIYECHELLRKVKEIITT